MGALAALHPRQIKRYGWRRDILDARDYQLRVPYWRRLTYPSSVDLRAHMPGVYDQGDLGSCTGNAIAGAIEYQRKRQGLSDFVPSRLFIYYNERVIEGTADSDSGAQIRDGIKSVATVGACSETEWPYNVGQFATKPSDQCYADAKSDIVSTYARVAQASSIIKATLAQGYAIPFGFTVYASFEDIGYNGIMPMPDTDNESVLGGHAVLLSGYTPSYGIVRNSWGPSWGDHGYFYMPWAYLLNANLCDDFWAIETVAS